jgi:hypothetical protein
MNISNLPVEILAEILKECNLGSLDSVMAGSSNPRIVGVAMDRRNSCAFFSKLTSRPRDLMGFMMESDVYLHDVRAAAYFYPDVNYESSPWKFACSSKESMNLFYNRLIGMGMELKDDMPLFNRDTQEEHIHLSKTIIGVWNDQDIHIEQYSNFCCGRRLSGLQTSSTLRCVINGYYAMSLYHDMYSKGLKVPADDYHARRPTYLDQEKGGSLLLDFEAFMGEDYSNEDFRVAHGMRFLSIADKQYVSKMTTTMESHVAHLMELRIMPPVCHHCNMIYAPKIYDIMTRSRPTRKIQVDEYHRVISTQFSSYFAKEITKEAAAAYPKWLRKAYITSPLWEEITRDAPWQGE